MATNEATFEAQVHGELARMFPTLDPLQFTHQTVFTIRLGHKTQKVDGALIKGRLDVLVSYRQTPLAVLELKAPDIPLTDDDRDQGISYARLMTPMPPLVVVSNGRDETRFYQTYDAKPWVAAQKDEATLQLLMRQGLQCASTDLDNAVRLLVGGNPIIWSNVIHEHTREALLSLDGELNEFTKPLAREFSIPRRIATSIREALRKGDRLIALTGAPLSGKTNVLSQLCRDADGSGLVFLYVDVASTNHGVFQLLANAFSNAMFISTSPQEVRHWIVNGLRSPVDGRLVVVIDGMSVVDAGTIKNDLDELISLTRGHSISVVIATHDAAFDSAKHNPGRGTSSPVGTATRMRVLPLDDAELADAQKVFLRNHMVQMDEGSDHNASYRHPQVLRMMVAVVAPHIPRVTPKDGDIVEVATLSSIMGIEHLLGVWRLVGDNLELQQDLRELARTFIADASGRKSNPSLNIMAFGEGHIRIETAEKLLDAARLRRLREQGYLRLVKGPQEAILLLPTVPLLLSASAPAIIAESALAAKGKAEPAAIYRQLLLDSSVFPFGDVVAATALLHLSPHSGAMFGDMLVRLLEDPPKKSRITGGHVAVAHFDDVGEIRLHIGAGVHLDTIENMQPWLALAHLARWRLEDTKGDRHCQLVVLAQVGAFRDILRQPEKVPLKEMKPLCVHDIKGYGTVLCGKSGIVEPITAAMQSCFLQMPERMMDLCQFAVRQKCLALVYRLKIAADSVAHCTDEKVSEGSASCARVLAPAITENLHRAMLKAKRVNRKHRKKRRR